MSNITIGSSGMVMDGGCDTGYTVSSYGTLQKGGCSTPYEVRSGMSLWNRDIGADTGKMLEDLILRPYLF
jgi:uncharacterized membrane protein YedE/YeeE